MLQDQIISTLRASGSAMSCKEIADQLDRKHSEISRPLTDLVKNGVLERLEGDRYNAATYVLATTAPSAEIKPATPAEVAAMNKAHSAKQKEEMRDYLTTAGIIAGDTAYPPLQPQIHPVVDGAYHGMVEPHPDDAPQIVEVGTQKILIVDASAPIDFDSLVEPHEANAICDDCINYNRCAKGVELEQCLAEMEREKREDNRFADLFAEMERQKHEDDPFADLKLSIVRITKALEDYRASLPKDEYESSLELALTSLSTAIRVGGAKCC